MATKTRRCKSAKFGGYFWLLKWVGLFNYFQHLCQRESQNSKYY